MIRFHMRFDPSYLWIGVMWQYQPSAHGAGYLNRPRFDLWLCLLPCLPIHVAWLGDLTKSPEDASCANQEPSDEIQWTEYDKAFFKAREQDPYL